jgi:hypothetical protein
MLDFLEIHKNLAIQGIEFSYLQCYNYDLWEVLLTSVPPISPINRITIIRTGNTPECALDKAIVAFKARLDGSYRDNYSHKEPINRAQKSIKRKFTSDDF